MFRFKKYFLHSFYFFRLMQNMFAYLSSQIVPYAASRMKEWWVIQLHFGVFDVDVMSFLVRPQKGRFTYSGAGKLFNQRRKGIGIETRQYFTYKSHFRLSSRFSTAISPRSDQSVVVHYCSYVDAVFDFVLHAASVNIGARPAFI